MKFPSVYAIMLQYAGVMETPGDPAKAQRQRVSWGKDEQRRE